MTNLDVVFCRRLLVDLKPSLVAVGVDMTKHAWVWNAGRGHWEFHGPDSFYWHGRAANAYEARFKGWSAWITERTWRGFKKGDLVTMMVETRGATADDEEMIYPAGTPAVITSVGDYGAQGRGVEIAIGLGDQSIVNTFDDADGIVPFARP